MYCNMMNNGTLLNFSLENDEVILYEGEVGFKIDAKKGATKLLLTLTSTRMIFEQVRGVFKKEKDLIDIIPLNEIKVFNGEIQCQQKNKELYIQTIGKNFFLVFLGYFQASKVSTKIINAVTGTTVAERGSDKVKQAFDLVDDTLGLDTRGIARGFLENGVKGTIINGLKGKKE